MKLRDLERQFAAAISSGLSSHPEGAVVVDQQPQVDPPTLPLIENIDQQPQPEADVVVDQQPRMDPPTLPLRENRETDNETFHCKYPYLLNLSVCVCMKI